MLRYEKDDKRVLRCALLLIFSFVVRCKCTHYYRICVSVHRYLLVRDIIREERCWRWCREMEMKEAQRGHRCRRLRLCIGAGLSIRWLTVTLLVVVVAYVVVQHDPTTPLPSLGSLDDQNEIRRSTRHVPPVGVHDHPSQRNPKAHVTRRITHITTHAGSGLDRFVQWLVVRCLVKDVTWTSWDYVNDALHEHRTWNDAPRYDSDGCYHVDHMPHTASFLDIHVLPLLVALSAADLQALKASMQPRLLRDWKDEIASRGNEKEHRRSMAFVRRHARAALSSAWIDQVALPSLDNAGVKDALGLTSRCSALRCVVRQQENGTIETVDICTALEASIQGSDGGGDALQHVARMPDDWLLASDDLVEVEALRIPPTEPHHKIMQVFHRLLERLGVVGIPKSDDVDLVADAYRLVAGSHTWWDAPDLLESYLSELQLKKRRTLKAKLHKDVSEEDQGGKRWWRQLVQRDRTTDYWIANRHCALDGPWTALSKHTTNAPVTLAPKNRTVPWSLYQHRRLREVNEFCGLRDLGERDRVYRFTPSGRVGEGAAARRSPRALRCGWLRPAAALTPFHAIREAFLSRWSSTCSLVIFTFLTDCYDPLPVVYSHHIPAGTCLIAMMDHATYEAIGRRQSDRFHVVASKGGKRKGVGVNAQRPRKPTWIVLNVDDAKWRPRRDEDGDAWHGAFSSKIRVIEMLKLSGTYLFPTASRVIWLDGKAILYDLPKLLMRIASVSGPHSPSSSSRRSRPSSPPASPPPSTVLYAMRSYFHDSRSKYHGAFDLDKEFVETKLYLAERYGLVLPSNGSDRSRGGEEVLHRSARAEEGQTVMDEMNAQERQYREEGFFDAAKEGQWFSTMAGPHSRLTQGLESIKTQMLDIAAISDAPADPCAQRLMCAWLSEVCYFSYRGQLSVHYALHRLQLLAFLGVEPNFYLQATPHHPVCHVLNGSRIPLN